MGAAFAAAFVAGGVTISALSAVAQGMPPHMMGGGRHSPAEAMKHIDGMLDRVSATPEQKSRIHELLRVGFAPMAGLHEEMRQTHARLHDILSAPTIDRAALEQLRAGEIAKLDEASREVTRAMADSAEVLTPAQRAKLAAIMSTEHRPS